MARFTPATPRSRRLGRELRRLRDEAGLTLEDVGKAIDSSGSRVQRIETGEIKVRPGDVLELLKAYHIPLDGDVASELTEAASKLRQDSWWQKYGTLSNRYATYIAYEDEATDLYNFEPALIPGLLQTEDYARVVAGVGRETETQVIEDAVQTRMKRRDVLTKRKPPLRLHAIVSEAAILTEVGGQEVLRDQLLHIVELSKRPNVSVQVLRFAAGAHLAINGAFAVLTLDRIESLGYIETLAGELFIEAPKEIARLTTTYDHLKTLAMSPAESVRYLKERADAAGP